MIHADDFQAEGLVRALIARGQYQSAANLLKAMAAVRAAAMPVHAVNCGCSHCKRRRLDHQLRLNRQWEALRAGVAA